jgi:hypothetical protein
MNLHYKIALGLAMAMVAQPAAADDTGVATSLHASMRVGNKLCLIDHSHAGSSSGLPTVAAAKNEAIKAWSGFTAWEYGTDWANIRKAIRVSMRCSQSSGGWGCDLDANPCKQVGR